MCAVSSVTFSQIIFLITFETEKQSFGPTLLGSFLKLVGFSWRTGSFGESLFLSDDAAELVELLDALRLSDMKLLRGGGADCACCGGIGGGQLG